ncbi:MAG: S8 family serine peptidase [Bacteroidia bacterium]
MKYYRLLLILLLFSCVNNYAQDLKMNMSLAKKEHSASTGLIDVFVKGDLSAITSITNAVNGKVRYSAGDIAAVHVPASALSQFVSDRRIKRVEAYPPRFRPMNDTMLVNNNVPPVHNGQAPLPQAYNGAGVIVGIIDTGVDFSHPDLRDSLGNTRIKYLWDQTQPLAANTPSYGYGQEWDSAGIDGGLAAAHTDIPWNGHGTHVTGVAAGNGLASGTYKGVAFKSDLVVVAFDFNSTSPTVMTDAVDYIYTKADLLGKPCVINASLGDYMGSHDGLDLQAQMIKNMITAQNGRSFVAAAGNAGDIPFHLGYTVTSDTNFTWFHTGATIYFQIWSDTSNFKNVNFSIGADNMSPYSFRGNIPFSNIASHLSGLLADTLYNSGNRIGIVESFGSLAGGVYSMEFLITPDSTAYNWRLMCTGNGKFDLWSFNMISSGLPSAAIMPDSIYYKAPDLTQTMVSSFQCLDEVITVGNYTNRRSMLNYNSVMFIDYTRVPGRRHPNSSCGPTRDGRIKPDIAAPGDFVMSCSLLSNLPADAVAYPDYYDPGGYHTLGGGTSAASPGVAGIAALYLQKNPTASAAAVKNAIISCPTVDGFTGVVPNNQYGYGKANAFNALTNCLTTGIESADENEFLVYPNPSGSGSVAIRMPGSWKGITFLKIYSSMGALAASKQIEGSTVEIRDLSPGMYFFQLIQNEKAVAAEKILILPK